MILLPKNLLTFKRLVVLRLKHKPEIYHRWGTILPISVKVEKVITVRKWTSQYEIVYTKKKVKKRWFEIFSFRDFPKDNIKQTNRLKMTKNLSFRTSKDIR